MDDRRGTFLLQLLSLGVAAIAGIIGYFAYELLPTEPYAGVFLLILALGFILIAWGLFKNTYL